MAARSHTHSQLKYIRRWCVRVVLRSFPGPENRTPDRVAGSFPNLRFLLFPLRTTYTGPRRSQQRGASDLGATLAEHLRFTVML